MRIDRFRVLNFKSYFDSGEIKLSPGINLVVGRNSAGKSVLLDALGLRFLGRPHRSLRSLPHRDDPESPLSRVEITGSCDGAELKRTFLKGGGRFHYPWPKGRPKNEQNARALIEEIFSARPATLRLQAQAGLNGPAAVQGSGGLPLSWAGAPAESDFEVNAFDLSPDAERRAVGAVGFTASGHDLGVLATHTLLPRLFRFQAERLNVGTCHHGISTILAPNAQNLPEVLSNLQANRDLFDDYIRRVREVFPIVESIAVRSAANNQVEIRVWQLPQASRRDDLAFPLNECGTGIGQVLAILYVAMASEDPQIILVDEPNSFLHPGAARALIRVLRQIPQHQYVIATHAPEVISEAGDCPVIQVQWGGGESRCEVFTAKTTEVSRRLLLDVGARLSDVFGFDEILWVEGPSDQACINAILKVRFPPRPGLAVLPVRDTGNFDRRRARDVVAIYRQASMASALLPPTIGFLLDREKRTDRDMDQIMNETDRAVSFLQRAMIENYLMSPPAIADVLATAGDVGQHQRVEDIEYWIRSNGNAREYRAPEFEPFADGWLSRVDGARLLRDLFLECTNNTIEFRKTEHCEALVSSIVSKQPQFLEPLVDLLESKLRYRRLAAGGTSVQIADSSGESGTTNVDTSIPDKYAITTPDK